MSKEYASPLILEFKTSKISHFYLLSVHCLAMTGLFYSGLPLILKLLLSLLIIISFFYLKKGEGQVIKAVWLSENDWVIVDRFGTQVASRLTPLSFRCSWLVILSLKTDEGKNISLMIPFDALDPDIFRQLKVKLKLIKPSIFSPSSE